MILLALAILNGLYGKIYADKGRDKSISSLEGMFGTLNTNSIIQFAAIRDLQGVDKMHTEEISELQKSILQTNSSLSRMEARLMRLERNQDRIGWVVDELAKKNGISPPKPIPEQN